MKNFFICVLCTVLIGSCIILTKDNSYNLTNNFIVVSLVDGDEKTYNFLRANEFKYSAADHANFYVITNNGICNISYSLEAAKKNDFVDSCGMFELTKKLDKLNAYRQLAGRINLAGYKIAANKKTDIEESDIQNFIRYQIGESVVAVDPKISIKFASSTTQKSIDFIAKMRPDGKIEISNISS